MTLTKIMLICAVLGVSSVASAQPQYQAYPYNQVPAVPQSWYYNPYTSGLGPCPQRLFGGDAPCSETMPPSYGQPSYWPSVP